MTEWHEYRDLPWIRFWEAWFTSPSHSDLGIVTLGIGARLLQLANRRGRKSDGSGSVFCTPGKAMSVKGMAHAAHATTRQTKKAIAELEAVGTITLSEDTEGDTLVIFPSLRRWQESPSAERQRRHRKRDSNAQMEDVRSEEILVDQEEGKQQTSPTAEDPQPSGSLFSGEVEGDPAPNIVALFRCRGGAQWPLTTAHVARWEAACSAAGVPTAIATEALRKAWKWCEENPRKRKAPGSMEKWLDSIWVSEAIEKAIMRDHGGARSNGKSDAPRPVPASGPGWDTVPTRAEVERQSPEDIAEGIRLVKEQLKGKA